MIIKHKLNNSTDILKNAKRLNLFIKTKSFVCEINPGYADDQRNNYTQCKVIN